MFFIIFSTGSQVPTLKINKRGIILLNNNPLSSGVGRYAYSLYKNLIKIGAKISMISWENELFSPKFVRLRNLRVDWLLYLMKFKRLERSLRNIDGGLFHITNTGYLAEVANHINISTIVMTVHDLISFVTPRSIFDCFSRKAMKNICKANCVICVSENTRRDLFRFFDVDHKEVRVIYHGVDHKLFKPRDKLEARHKLGLPLDRPIVLNVGSEEPRKNVPILLKSFEKLLNDVPDALLVRVGERTHQTAKIIETLGLKGKVLYCKAPESEVALYYNVADLLVHPAYYEGFGNPPLEAMASALPVIAGNRTSIPEVVGDAGILLDPFDVNGFAYWMQEVLTNEDLRARLSEAGYERSLGFSWEKCARETLEVYKEVLEEV